MNENLISKSYPVIVKTIHALQIIKEVKDKLIVSFLKTPPEVVIIHDSPQLFVVVHVQYNVGDGLGKSSSLSLWPNSSVNSGISYLSLPRPCSGH